MKINKVLIIILLLISITTLWLNIQNEKKQIEKKDYSFYEMLSKRSN